jgi:predicted phage baseplate assembly protein
VRVSNPVPTWGGADAESVADGEKQIRRRLQNRDRLVTAGDFVSIAWRTPGLDIGRIEVLAAAHPSVWPVATGSVPGAVTVLAIPRFDAAHPAAPRPDRLFVDALCGHLDPRRLVTTELAIRGPSYVGIWVSVGIEIAGGQSAAEVIERVKAQVKAHLSPLPREGLSIRELVEPLYAPEADPALRGWPLGRAVNARTILAEAARAPGVISVADVLLAQGAGPATESVAMQGLELPELLGISVTVGDPAPLDQLRGAAPTPGGTVRRLPVPVLAETC